ncbi:NAD(P)/FAD-dependent oxidoreductase [Candidatus Galacturonibacter soehngenii]|uniref:NAD(P)/FAD-dependent oxidoreductase n=1 Tax=Candidatus Galacturonatibacter soehngenii TaxID=2307010 RepID=A0A7V7QLK3_9FIRM|nr:NAD(P)/FAD-dependent oxidoreductase [Candidatus Galacturonibacter soehngenii]KAB1439426.1 NAD(P)/FAD-dependent oxidoreductase [Candidatus Galacturonibacter soehngenii]MBA4687290.1 NAD(P)/FAD-dependent oxidoreductase [Candidatus Galacturonibacter soehngenii]
MSKVLIVGAGAAGMFAAIYAARNHNEVILFDGNEKLGKKLFITGKGRCNITNACDMDTLFDHVISNRKFLYSAFYGYNNYDVIDFFEELGVKTKIERGNRVFPVSDHSSDVINALGKELQKNGVIVNLKTKVKNIIIEEGQAKGLCLDNGKKVYGEHVIIATGGLSYPTTGSTGDGYDFAKKAGHTITRLTPSLVPFKVKENFVKELQGLSLKNVKASILDGKKQLYSDFGEMLFTHFGVSGPLMLSASSFAADKIKKNSLKLIIDLKPALSEEQLDMRLVREFENYKNKQFKNAVTSLFPSKLIPIMIDLSGIHPDKKVNEITKEERLSFVSLIKNLELTLIGLCDYNQAIITKGGVSVKEINPSTMESKLVKQLYFIGEVLDLDALTGGFNLQIAWSSAYAAGSSIW